MTTNGRLTLADLQELNYTELSQEAASQVEESPLVTNVEWCGVSGSHYPDLLFYATLENGEEIEMYVKRTTDV